MMVGGGATIRSPEALATIFWMDAEINIAAHSGAYEEYIVTADQVNGG
jgi:hypothetical protein